MFTILAIGAASAATYFWAKKRKKSDKSSAMLALAAGGATFATASIVAGVFAMWPIVLVGGGVYAYAAYNKKQKALGPGDSP